MREIFHVIKSKQLLSTHYGITIVTSEYSSWWWPRIKRDKQLRICILYVHIVPNKDVYIYISYMERINMKRLFWRCFKLTCWVLFLYQTFKCFEKFFLQKTATKNSYVNQEKYPRYSPEIKEEVKLIFFRLS